MGRPVCWICLCIEDEDGRCGCPEYRKSRAKYRRKHPNPWDLTHREVEVLQAVIELGSLKLAADRLCVTVKAVEYTLGKAKKKVKVRTLVHLIVAVDRWFRENKSP